MVVWIAGERMYLWRAVDHEGEVLDKRASGGIPGAREQEVLTGKGG
jgi:hypothetical protein